LSSSSLPPPRDAVVESVVNDLEQSAFESARLQSPTKASSPLPQSRLDKMRFANAAIDAGIATSLVEGYFRGPLHAGWFVRSP
jgi:hypothetical protein